MINKDENELKMLEEQQKKIHKMAQPLQDKIDDIREKIRLEKFSKYVGKCYIYKNSNSMDHWNLYIKAVSLNKGYNCINLIEVQKYKGCVEIKKVESSGDYLFENEISEAEFNKHYNAMIKELNDSVKGEKNDIKKS